MKTSVASIIIRDDSGDEHRVNVSSDGNLMMNKIIQLVHSGKTGLAPLTLVYELVRDHIRLKKKNARLAEAHDRLAFEVETLKKSERRLEKEVRELSDSLKCNGRFMRDQELKISEYEQQAAELLAENSRLKFKLDMFD